MNSSKTAILAAQLRQKIDSICGWGLAVLAVGGFGVFFTDKNGNRFDPTYLVFGLVLAALAVLLILKARKTKTLVRSFKDYVQLLAGDPENSLENLASATNSSVDEVKKNLREMIKRKFFANASIDEKNNRLIIRRTNDMQQIIANSEAASRPAQKTTAKCPGCGATMAVEVGKVVACDYCGTMLKG